MPSGLHVSLTPGKQFVAGEEITNDKLNELGTPTVNLQGTISTQTLNDGAVTTSKLADGCLSADVAGRGKMADGFLTESKFAAGALGADATGRAVMANNFILPPKIQYNPGGLGASGTVNIDWATGLTFPIQATGTLTFTFSNQHDGQSILLAVQASGGSRTVNFPGGINWGPAGAPPQPIASGKTDFYCIVYAFGSHWGFYRQGF